MKRLLKHVSQLYKKEDAQGLLLPPVMPLCYPPLMPLHIGGGRFDLDLERFCPHLKVGGMLSISVWLSASVHLC